MSPQDKQNSAPTQQPLKGVGLLRATGTVGGMTTLSRISGLARDIAIAVIFGADAKTDAFFVAFKIPNFFRRLFAEGSFSQAFVPVFAQYKEKKDRAALKDLVAHVAGMLGGFLLLLTTLMAAAAPLVIYLLGPGFEAERHDLASAMLRYTAFYLLFISLVALAGSIQNSFQKFAAPAFTPVLLNLSLIGCAFWIGPQLEVPIMALAIAVFVAGAIQLMFQIPFLVQLGMLPRPRLQWKHEGVQKIIKLMLPAMLGSSVVQISLVLDTILASFLVAGSVSWLYMSDRLVELPLGIFSIAIATVLLPSLSSKHASENPQGFSRNLDWGMRLNTLITIPAAVGLVLLAGPILATLFQYGEFTGDKASMTRLSLIAYAVGLPAFGYVKILTPGFFARHDARTPLRITIYTVSAKLLLSVALVAPLYFQQIRWAHVGLALATSLSAWIQTLLLYRGLRREKAYQPQNGWLKLFLQILAATAAMSVMLCFTSPTFDAWLYYSLWQRGLTLTALIVPATAIFFCIMWFGGMRWHVFRGHH
ncbi:MAG: murein biosynthesis integral membrane protein MurJ [Gammaproteobacteria bacterium]|nr:murein biosynthesis integral membrane protein MurJ [Gammaproteobacteria bacterium]